MERKWGPSGDDRTQVVPMLAPWTLLSEKDDDQPMVDVVLQVILLVTGKMCVYLVLFFEYEIKLKQSN